jgi:hypothetical protein
MVATMKVTVVRPDELDASEEKLWQEFQSLSPMTAHPCFSLSYARSVCRADESGRVAVAEDDGKICAFLPYSTESDGVAATLGGAQTALDDLVSSHERIDLRAVVRGAGVRGWRFSRAPVEQLALEPYQREVREVSFEWNSNDPPHLSLLLNWKSNAFESMRTWLLSPLNRGLVRELTAGDSGDYSCLTSVLYADAKPISISLNLRRGHIHSQWISGFDPEYSRFSPGTLNMLAMFAEAPRAGWRSPTSATGMICTSNGSQVACIPWSVAVYGPIAWCRRLVPFIEKPASMLKCLRLRGKGSECG